MEKVGREQLYVVFYCTVVCLKMHNLQWIFMQKKDFKLMKDSVLHNHVRFSTSDIFNKF